jgi:hypothetical protein
MRVNVYYVVRPNGFLRNVVDSLDETTRDALGNALLCESSEGGRGITRVEDYEARAKVSFLIFVLQENSVAAAAVGVSGLEVSVATFDKYWTIERMELAGAVDEISGKDILDVGVDKTGSSFVDDWVERKTAGLR